VAYACIIGISGVLGVALYSAHVVLTLSALNHHLRPILRTLDEEGFRGEIDFRVAGVRVTIHRSSAPITAARGRAHLVQTLSGLAPGDMAKLVTLLEGAWPHVSSHDPVVEQAAGLVRWAEGPSGPGLDAVAESVAKL
jgi:hypothetical protein